jgi:hypothetical protein
MIMFSCPKCNAGASRLRLIGASPVKMAIRKIYLTCVDCKSGFTLRGNGMNFNEEVLRVSNNRAVIK